MKKETNDEWLARKFEELVVLPAWNALMKEAETNAKKAKSSKSP